MRKSSFGIVVCLSALAIFMVPILVSASLASESSVPVNAEQVTSVETRDNLSILENLDSEAAVSQQAVLEEPLFSFEPVTDAEGDKRSSTEARLKLLADEGTKGSADMLINLQLVANRISDVGTRVSDMASSDIDPGILYPNGNLAEIDQGIISSDITLSDTRLSDTTTESDSSTTSYNWSEDESTPRESEGTSAQVDPNQPLSRELFLTSLTLVTSAGGQEVDVANADTYTFKFAVTNVSGRDILLDRAPIFSNIYIYVSGGWQYVFRDLDYAPGGVRFANGETITEQFVLTKEQIKSYSTGNSVSCSLWAVPLISVDNLYTMLNIVSASIDVDLSETN